jgi:hypothetical protein
MNGRSVQKFGGWVLSLALLAGCGGERQTNSAAGRDTSVPAADTASGRAADTATSAAPDTATRRDSAVASRAPSPTAPAARTTPTKKPAAPKATASKPKVSRSDTAAAKSRPDTTAADTAARASTADTSAQTAASNEAPLRDPYHQAPLDTVAPVVYNGWKQFNLNCARCHGEDVQGTTIAPHLLVSLRPDGPINTKELFMQTVCAGRPAKGMPPWCALGMEMSTIESIYSYVKGRSDGKIHPGRPAQRPG